MCQIVREKLRHSWKRFRKVRPWTQETHFRNGKISIAANQPTENINGRLEKYLTASREQVRWLWALTVKVPRISRKSRFNTKVAFKTNKLLLWCKRANFRVNELQNHNLCQNWPWVWKTKRERHLETKESLVATQTWSSLWFLQAGLDPKPQKPHQISSVKTFQVVRTHKELWRLRRQLSPEILVTFRRFKTSRIKVDKQM